MSEHFSYLETVCRLAKAGWGKPFENSEAAEKALLNDPQKLAGFAVLEMLARFDKFINTMASPKIENDYNARPEWAHKYPHMNVGDRIWSGCIEDGFDEYMVVAKDEEGYARIIALDGGPIFYAGDDCGASLADAILRSAKSDIEYHAPRLAYAKRAIAAIESNQADLSGFLKGFKS